MQKNYIKIYFILTAILISISCNADYSSEFDSDRAYSELKKQCSFGARVPGTESHMKCVDYIYTYLNLYADTVYIQNFKKRVSYSDEIIEFKNIIAVFNNNSDVNIMLCSHFDSRPFSSVKGVPTPGANDGASSTAVLMEMARIMKEKRPENNVMLVFFDGEDAGRTNHPDEWFLGSKYFAGNYKGTMPDIAILIDMIGDADQHIYREGFSEIYNSDLNNKVFGIAEEMGILSFHNSVGYFVQDDHIPLNNAGIKCIDLIDWDYKYWHTPEDTPDKCSAESIQKIGDILLEIVYE